MAKNNQRDPNLRAATVARVNQLVKGGLTKAGAFEKISSESGRAKDAVQMLYYRAVRAGAKTAAKAAAPKVASAAPARAAAVVAAKSAATTPSTPAAAKPTRSRSRRSRKASGSSAAPRAQAVAQTGDFPSLLNGIAVAINNLLKHVEKTVEENVKLREQAQRLKAITSLVRGR